jgi:hypothetical protein
MELEMNRRSIFGAIAALWAVREAEGQKSDGKGGTTFTVPQYEGNVDSVMLARRLVEVSSMAAKFGNANIAVLLKSLAAFLITDGGELRVYPSSEESELTVIATLTVKMPVSAQEPK